MVDFSLFLIGLGNAVSGLAVSILVLAFTQHAPVTLLAGEMTVCLVGWAIYSVLAGVLPESLPSVGSPETLASDPSAVLPS